MREMLESGEDEIYSRESLYCVETVECSQRLINQVLELRRDSI